MANEPKKQAELIWKRWCDIFLYSFIAAAFYYLIGTEPFNYWQTFYNKLNTLQVVIAHFLAFILALALCTKFKIINPKHYTLKKHALGLLLKHPPLYIASLLAVIWLAIGISAAIAALICAAIIATTFSILAIKLNPSLPPAITELGDIGEDISTWRPEEIIEWVTNEKPAKKLLFDRDLYVKRLFKLITQGATQSKRIALVGEYGSGKSSVVERIEQSLTAHQKDYWVIVKVDCWGRDPATIDEQILSLAIDQLAKITDVSGYIRLPSQFHNALKSQGGWFATLSHFLVGENHDAKAQLAKINDLLTLLNKRLLLIIEDPDRGEEAIARHRCDRIAALMDRLGNKQVPNISFIFCLGSEQHYSDAVIRICEYREDLSDESPLFKEVIDEVIAKIWLQPKGKKIIHPNGAERKFEANIKIGAPRNFKKILREIDYIWRDPGFLCGEIDLVHLVYLTLCKELHPDIFESIENAAKLRSLGVNTWIQPPIDFNSSQEKIQLEKAAIDNGEIKFKKTTHDGVSLTEEINSPSKITIEKITLLNKLINKENHIQTSSSHGNIDYLQRFYRKNINKTEKFDQETLREIQKTANQFIEGGKPTPSNIQHLIICGALSPYFYQLLASESSKIWFEIGKAIIQQTPNTQYQNNDQGHPAIPHLKKIIAYLFNIEERKHSFKNLSSKLLLMALEDAPETTRELLPRNPENDWLTSNISPEEKWVYFRTAINSTLQNSSEISDSMWYLLNDPNSPDNETASVGVACIKAHVAKNKIENSDLSAINKWLNTLQASSPDMKSNGGNPNLATVDLNKEIENLKKQLIPIKNKIEQKLSQQP